MIKVIAAKVDNEGICSFIVKLDRTTDILAKELFTQADIDAAKQQGIKEFLEKLGELCFK